MQDVADVREDDGSTTDRFLIRMRAALSDLPPAEVDELLEDTEEHVRELAVEHGEDQLELRLGSPEAYAAELRSAAGSQLDPTLVEALLEIVADEAPAPEPQPVSPDAAGAPQPQLEYGFARQAC